MSFSVKNFTKVRPSAFFYLLCVIASTKEIYGLKITASYFPSHVIRGQSMNLTCEYDTEGATIYQVKWYKDSEEFYSYLPQKPSRSYPVSGVSLNLNASGSMNVLLTRVNRNSEGTYTCEVTLDKTYVTKVHRGAVQVVDLPLRAPEVSGSHRKYMEVGDVILINCTSHSSRPLAEINWYINSARPNSKSLIKYPDNLSEDGLGTRTLGLRLTLRGSHFRPAGVLTLKCACQIESIYYTSVDVEVYSRAQAVHTKISAGTIVSERAWHIFLAFLISLQYLAALAVD